MSAAAVEPRRSQRNLNRAKSILIQAPIPSRKDGDVDVPDDGSEVPIINIIKHEISIIQEDHPLRSYVIEIIKIVLGLIDTLHDFWTTPIKIDNVKRYEFTSEHSKLFTYIKHEINIVRQEPYFEKCRPFIEHINICIINKKLINMNVWMDQVNSEHVDTNTIIKLFNFYDKQKNQILFKNSLIKLLNKPSTYIYTLTTNIITNFKNLLHILNIDDSNIPDENILLHRNLIYYIIQIVHIIILPILKNMNYPLILNFLGNDNIENLMGIFYTLFKINLINSIETFYNTMLQKIIIKIISTPEIIIELLKRKDMHDILLKDIESIDFNQPLILLELLQPKSELNNKLIENIKANNLLINLLINNPIIRGRIINYFQRKIIAPIEAIKFMTFPSSYILDQRTNNDEWHAMGYSLFINNKRDFGPAPTYNSIIKNTNAKKHYLENLNDEGPLKYNIYGIQYNDNPYRFSRYTFYPDDTDSSTPKAITGIYTTDADVDEVITVIENTISNIKHAINKHGDMNHLGLLYGAKRMGDWIQCEQAANYKVLLQTGDFWCKMYALLIDAPIIIDNYLYNYDPAKDYSEDKSKQHPNWYIFSSRIKQSSPEFTTPLISEPSNSLPVTFYQKSDTYHVDAAGVAPGRVKLPEDFESLKISITHDNFFRIVKKYLKYKNKYLKIKTGKIINNHEKDAIINNLLENVNIEQIKNKYLKYKNKYLKINI